MTEIYRDTKDTWEAMLTACSEAKVSIDIEQYIFAANSIGNKFLDIFKQKASEGVKIRMLLDAAGSYTFYNSPIPDVLRGLGIEVRFFNMISPWRIHNFFSWFFRNHKKSLIIDGAIGFTGGTGVSDHMANWRDTNGKVVGDPAREMTESFNEMWGLSQEKDFVARFEIFRRSKEKNTFITNAPYFKKRFLYHALMKAFSKATKSIHITTPYFIPDRRLIRILKNAARRGVEVIVILPEIIDVPVVASASHSSFDELLREGVRIFKYRPYILHAKTAVVDEEWGSYGSFNLDSLSFRYNYEANIITTDHHSVSELEKHFQSDLTHSREITFLEWRKRKLIRKMQEFFVAPIRGFL